MYAEPPGDRNHALAVRSGSSNSVHLAVRQRCSSSSPRVRYDLGLVLDCILRLVAKTEFRLFPRGTEPLEPLLGVRFESARVHLGGSVELYSQCFPHFFCLSEFLEGDFCTVVEEP